MQYIPNALTLSRGAIAIWLPFADWGWVSWWLALYAIATDLLDGELARRFGWETPWGARADALIDKVFVVCATIYIARHVPVNLFEMILGSAILLREFLVEGLRIWMGRYGVTISSSPLAKWKTACQMVLILLYTIPLMPPEALHHALEPLLSGLLGIVAALTVLSAVRYVREELRALARV